MASLSICLFGPLQVTLAGIPVTAFESDKARALLAYLAVEADHPHRREKLAGLLWPDLPERAARANLAHVLAHVRGAIGDRDAKPPFLHITRQSLQWNTASDARIDANTFNSLLQGQQPTLTDLEEAVDLYRGPFLEGFSLPDSSAFEEWALIERERLQRLALDALHRLAEGHGEQGDVTRAQSHAWRLLELDPWRESGQQMVMRLLALDGQRAAALSQYDSWRKRLAEELGVEPAAETIALHEQIRNGTLAPTPTPGAQPAPPHNLPAPLTPFIGRKAELAELGGRLKDPDCRLLTLVGPGGIGKTRLALEAARARLDDYPGGVFQVRLAGLSSTEGVVPAIAAAIGFRFGPSREPSEQLLDYLRARRILLLLDNFEHLLEGAGLLVEILRAASRAKIMVTSRAKLNLKGEHLFPVVGLAYPELSSPSLSGELPGPSQAPTERPIGDYDAIQLFLGGAQRACSGFELANHGQDVAAICRAVEGVPLAVLLASAWVAELAPGEIAARLSDGAGRRLDLLESEWADVPERHRSMRAAFEHSWRLLSPRQQTRFAALSVFRGGFDVEAAEAVSGARLSDLRRLADRCFVQRLPGGRWEVHELMRQHGHERLEADMAAWASAHDRHCTHYTARLEAWNADLTGARQYEALAEMDLDHDNARGAWEWAVEHAQVHRIDRAADGLSRFYHWRVRMVERQSALCLAEERLSEMISGADDVAGEPDQRHPEVLRIGAKVLALAIQQANEEDGLDLFRRAESLLDRPELAGHDTRRERAQLREKATMCFWNSDPGLARRFEEESLSLYRELGDTWEVATRLLHLGHVLLRAPAYGEPRGEAWEQARACLEEALALDRELGCVRTEGLVLGQLGTLALLQGQWAKGERLVKRFINAWWEAGDTISLIGQLDGVAVTLAIMGRFSEARFVMEETLDLYSEVGDRRGEITARLRLEEMLRDLGQSAEARTLCNVALALSREENDAFNIGRCRLSLGSVELAEEEWKQARHHYQESARVFREHPNERNLNLSLAGLALSFLRLGDWNSARGCLVEGLQLSIASRDLHCMIWLASVVAVRGMDLGETERAVELCAGISRLPYVKRSDFWEVIVGQHVTAAARSLPPEVVAAAQERGRARDLETTAREILEELEAEIAHGSGTDQRQEMAVP